MGTVYLAEHILLNRPRALKFISSELSQDATFLRRFRREAQAAIELRHPNIVEVVDLDQAEDGSPYIAMEYVEGPDLRHALSQDARHTDSDLDLYQGTTSVVPQRRQNESGVLTPEGIFAVPRALHIARGIAQGLGAAHAKGIIHRDIKPENILLAGGEGKPETPKLLDFGIAAMKESATVSSRTHGLLLTPPYAAPEQWKGMAADQLDGRTDLYALGNLFYEMLTSQTPFHAHNTEGWMYQHLHEQPQPPSQLRPELAKWQGLDALVLRLLAKEREQRPRDVNEMISLLDAVRLVASSRRPATVLEERRPTTVEDSHRAQTIPAERMEPQPAVQSQPKSKPVSGTRLGRVNGWRILILILVLATAGFAVWFYWSHHLTQPPAQSPPPYASNEQQAEVLFGQSRYTEARPLFEQACAGGNGDACNYLGILYLDGFGVAKNSAKATDYYAKACNAGNSTACVNLAGCYRDGVGVKKDIKKQKQYLNKACSLGDQMGCVELQNLSDHSSSPPAPQQTDIASQSAQTWTDPATGLMWTKKDNGKDVTWQQAKEYCRNLQLDGYSDWRLPTFDELQGIYDANANVDGFHVKGNLQLSGGWPWSSSPGDTSGQAWAFDYGSGVRLSRVLGFGNSNRALCVRGAASKGPTPAVNPATVVQIPSNSVSVNPPQTIPASVNPQPNHPAPVNPPSNPTPSTPQTVANSNLVWTDPATGLMWTKHDNGKGVNWNSAADYCRKLRLAGYSDWRLATIEELQGICDMNAEVRSASGLVSDHIKGDLSISGAVWSSSPGKSSRERWTFDFYYGSGVSIGAKDGPDRRALCVRR
jgi:serine/threonine-protein kinase